MKNARYLIFGFLAALFFAGIFCNKLVLDLSKPIEIRGDTAQNYFILQNDLEKISSLDFKNYFENRMYYPRKSVVTLGNDFIVQAIIGMPVFLLSHNPILTYNFVLLFDRVATFFAAFLLIYQFTKKSTSAIIGALIYSYNPLVMAHYPYHLALMTLEWIPLIFLTTKIFLETKKSWWGALLVSLFFIQFLSSFYYFAFLVFLWPLFVVLTMKIEKIDWRIWLRPVIILSIIAVIVPSFLYILPFVATKNQYGIQRSLAEVSIDSARISDFLFTSNNNFLYRWLLQNDNLKNLRNPYIAEHFSEHALFPGLVVAGLFLLSLVLFINKKFQSEEKKIVALWLFIFVVALVLSFGPIFNFGPVSFPSPSYLFYKFFPLFDGLRVMVRFMIVGYLAVGVIVGFLWNYLESKFVTKKRVLFVVAIVLITFEYFNLPVRGESVPVQTQKLYSWVNGQSSVSAIVELPIANGFYARPDWVRQSIDEGVYLFYGTMHHKKIVNGYQSFTPADDLGLGSMLTVNFPTALKLDYLKKLGVGLVNVHLDEYTDRKIGEDVTNKMAKLGYQPDFKTDNIYSYLIK